MRRGLSASRTPATARRCARSLLLLLRRDATCTLPLLILSSPERCAALSARSVERARNRTGTPPRPNRARRSQDGRIWRTKGQGQSGKVECNYTRNNSHHHKVSQAHNGNRLLVFCCMLLVIFRSKHHDLFIKPDIFCIKNDILSLK